MGVRLRAKPLTGGGGVPPAPPEFYAGAAVIGERILFLTLQELQAACGDSTILSRALAQIAPLSGSGAPPPATMDDADASRSAGLDDAETEVIASSSKPAGRRQREQQGQQQVQRLQGSSRVVYARLSCLPVTLDVGRGSGRSGSVASTGTLGPRVQNGKFVSQLGMHVLSKAQLVDGGIELK